MTCSRIRELKRCFRRNALSDIKVDLKLLFFKTTFINMKDCNKVKKTNIYISLGSFKKE